MLDRLHRALGRADERRDTKARQGGFTLIELLVVITILGILAAVVVFSVSGIGDRGQSAACKTDTVTIKTAEEAYYALPGHAVYTDMGTLVTSGLLSTASTLHGVTLTGTSPNFTAYTVTDLTTACTDS
jgi:prepilin-type N-terminal cleavage/methylation domain-containing protein